MGKTPDTRSNKVKLIHKLLKDDLWPETLTPLVVYTRLHDDHEGEFEGRIVVEFTQDGDAWVWTDQHAGSALRFRTDFGGGGNSPRVRNALMVLAEAIRLDNLERPEREKN